MQHTALVRLLIKAIMTVLPQVYEICVISSNGVAALITIGT